MAISHNNHKIIVLNIFSQINTSFKTKELVPVLFNLISSRITFVKSCQSNSLKDDSLSNLYLGQFKNYNS